MDPHPFREPFAFHNSDAAIKRFPFPFPSDTYRVSVNLEPHTRGGPTEAFASAFDVDEHYVAECAERALVLAQDPGRCQALPHMRAAEWDALELLMQSLAADFPQHFALRCDGPRWRWHNRKLGLRHEFTFGDAATLPQPPLEYIARQAQGDFTLQDQRDGTLWLDAGILTTQAGWSLDFDLGMNFHELHGPVPGAIHDAGVFDRALSYLLRLRHGLPARRVNWGVTVHPRLDTSSENYPLWAPDRLSVTAGNVGDLVHLRVELQTLFRLPRSNAILFGIRCYLLPLRDIARVPNWRRRLHRVLRGLDREAIDYKGLERNLPLMLDWLAPFDDGASTAPGVAPDALLPPLASTRSARACAASSACS